MPHKHWSKEHPAYTVAPTCEMTVKACDEAVTQFNHGHAGRPCVKAIQPSKTKKGQSNKTATCAIVTKPERGMSFAGLLSLAVGTLSNDGSYDKVPADDPLHSTTPSLEARDQWLAKSAAAPPAHPDGVRGRP